MAEETKPKREVKVKPLGVLMCAICGDPLAEHKITKPCIPPGTTCGPPIRRRSDR